MGAAASSKRQTTPGRTSLTASHLCGTFLPTVCGVDERPTRGWRGGVVPGPRAGGDDVKHRPRVLGLLVFVLAIALIQIAESLYFWYSYHEERLHLVELREELVDEGAEMIRAQLEAEQIREHLAVADSLLTQRRLQMGEVWGSARSGARVRSAYAAGLQELDAINLEIRRRNERLDRLNSTVRRRNEAAVRYHVLADSIRSLAVRAGEPYFSVPIPAQAAAERGITRDHPLLAADGGSSGGAAWGDRE
jgi:hypothetical protein